jgi:hypothetical protein
MSPLSNAAILLLAERSLKNNFFWLVVVPLTFIVRPETFENVVDLLVPELQRRGRYKTAYAKGGLREKLFGRARVNDRIRPPNTDGCKPDLHKFYRFDSFILT